MPVDRHIAAILDMYAGAGTPLELTDGSPATSRLRFRALTVGARDPRALAAVGSVEDSAIAGPGGDLRIRTYRPEAEGAVPTLLFFHGGGFVIGDLDTQDDHARLLCRDVGAVVVSVDYRLAPEHPFPRGLDDCLAATRWASAHIATLGGDPRRLAVSGDSAGGNLAAAVALASSSNGGPRLAAQLLLYPAVDMRDDDDGRYPSRVANASGPILTLDAMEWFASQYLADTARAGDPRASVVLAADLAGLPPAVVATAEYDPLRDEGEAYATRLAAAGVRVVVRRYPGMVHGFFGWGPWSAGAAEAIADICSAFRALL